MTEYTGILLITLRIRRYLSGLYMIISVCRIKQNHTMLTVKHFLCRIKSELTQSPLRSYTGHRAPALTFDEYLALSIFIRANLSSPIVISTQEPLSVPSILLHSLGHSLHASAYIFTCPLPL